MQLVFAQAKDPAFQFLIPIRSSQIKDMNQIAAFNDELLSLEKGSNQIEKPRIHHINKIILKLIIWKCLSLNILKLITKVMMDFQLLKFIMIIYQRRTHLVLIVLQRVWHIFVNAYYVTA